MENLYKLFLCVSLSLTGFTSFAQLEPGNWLLETSLGRFEGPFPEEQNQPFFRINAVVGYLPKEDLVVGVGFGATSFMNVSNETIQPTNGTRVDIHHNAPAFFAIAPFVRRYIWINEN